MILGVVFEEDDIYKTIPRDVISVVEVSDIKAYTSEIELYKTSFAVDPEDHINSLVATMIRNYGMYIHRDGCIIDMDFDYDKLDKNALYVSNNPLIYLKVLSFVRDNKLKEIGI
jgi:hypothetical protein